MCPLGQMYHTWKTTPHLKKCAKLGKLSNNLKNVLDFHKYGTVVNMSNLGKIGHTWQNALHLEKRATFGKIHHTYKNAPDLQKCAAP